MALTDCTTNTELGSEHRSMGVGSAITQIKSKLLGNLVKETKLSRSRKFEN